MKKAIKVIYLFAVIAGLTACKEYLDKEPLSDYLSSNFYNNEEAIRQGTNGVYQGIYMESSQLPFCTLLDMYTPMGIERADNASIGVNNLDLTTVFTIELHWANFYKGVGRCNTVLDGAEPFLSTLNDQAKKYLAEVKVIRAMHYHYLVSLYGDVPFFTKAVTEEEQKSALRKPWMEIVDAILLDLDDAAAILPWEAKELGRVDKSFALGLKARIALYAGSWNKEGYGKSGVKNPEKAKYYFNIAAKTASKIILESGRSLNSNFSELFTRIGQMNTASKKEILFSLIYSDQAAKKTHYQSFGETSRIFGQSGRFPTQLLVDSYEMRNGKRIDEAGSGYDPKKPFINRDPRLKATVYTQKDTIIGNSGSKKLKFLAEVFNPKTTSIDASGNTTLIDNLDYSGSVAQYGYIQSGVGYGWKKYNHFDDETVYLASYNIILMRYAEILLTYAEAKIELNEIDNSVYSAINDVRARVGMPNVITVDPSRSGNQSKMRQIVRRERKVELARESGLHFFDMRRWRTGSLENAEKTYGFPLATGVDPSKNTYPDGYSQVTPDMVPTYGAAGSDRDLNDLALYAAFGSKLRSRDVDRPKNWDDKFYLWPIPRTERNKAPQLTQNDGYGE
ncbi:MAG: RagB/SusD family nutrient uptake outer membrane protein [Prolixibacteraceae bacterium]|jgi:starch-binding outer membrane protein, SusD/RagB family